MAEQEAGRVEQYVGKLEDFFETGSEGTHWMLQRDPEPGEQVESGYDLLVTIEPGDRLEVYDEAGGVLWTGVIDPDVESNFYPYPYNPIYGQQAAGSRWVHWLQRGVAPDVWGEMFYEHRRARLTKGRGGARDERGLGNTDVVLPRLPDADLARVAPHLAFAMPRYLKGLDDAETAGLLGIDAATLAGWKEKPENARLSRALAERIAALLGMFRVLGSLAYKTEDRNAWLARDNPALGATPLAVMSAEGAEGIRRVRAHLEAAVQRAIRTRGEEIVF